MDQKLLSHGYEGITYFSSPSYESAFLGVHDFCTVYDFDLMVESLIEEGLEEIDAIEFIEYNTIRALPYIPNHPIIIYSTYETDDLTPIDFELDTLDEIKTLKLYEYEGEYYCLNTE